MDVNDIIISYIDSFNVFKELCSLADFNINKNVSNLLCTSNNSRQNFFYITSSPFDDYTRNYEIDVAIKGKTIVLDCRGASLECRRFNGIDQLGYLSYANGLQLHLQVIGSKRGFGCPLILEAMTRGYESVEFLWEEPRGDALRGTAIDLNKKACDNRDRARANRDRANAKLYHNTLSNESDVNDELERDLAALRTADSIQNFAELSHLLAEQRYMHDISGISLELTSNYLSERESLGRKIL